MATNTDLQASDLLRSKIKEFEGFELSAYLCPGNVWTIGAGHTKGVIKGMMITAEQAEEFLTEDITEVESQLHALNLPVLTVPQWDAICDFVFNLGIGNFKSSTLLKRIQAQASNDEIEKQFLRWVYSNGKKLNGLVKRRQWEAQRWKE